MLFPKSQSRFGSLPEIFYSRVQAEPFEHPFVAAFSEDAARLIKFDKNDSQAADFIKIFSGNKPVQGFDPYATVYAGHQFSVYVPELGDGRALTIAEVNGYEVQLKGSGKTPYSRFGDGRAVLRSCIREYLCSEAMAGLGIPTTRALCILGSDEPVMRETVERAAMLTRLAPSHIRFGHFEYFAHTGQYDALKTLADFTIEHYFPEHKSRYAEWFAEVVKRTARLMADWQLIGFTHGVMNTDNMSILGLTLDYGPFGFMDGYDAHYIPNHSDETGRYAYSAQPHIGLWNLNALASALTSLIESEALKTALRAYEPVFTEHFEAGMARKLGLSPNRPDSDFIRDTLALLHKTNVDYTLFFRRLSDDIRPLFPEKYQNLIENWLAAYQKKLAKNPCEESKAAMNKVNPKYILRNYLAETAIRKAEDEKDYSEIEKLRRILMHPFDEQPEHEAYAASPPDWAQSICLSCSS